MKQTFTKEEIRELIKEIISQKWHDFFFNPIGKAKRDIGQTLSKKKPKTEDDLFNNLELWIDTFVDDTGHYRGPQVGDFLDGFTFVRDPDKEITILDIKLLEKWNESYAEEKGLSRQSVWKANKEAYDSFRNRYDALGSFPT